MKKKHTKSFVPNPTVCEHCDKKLKIIHLEIGVFKQCPNCGLMTKK